MCQDSRQFHKKHVLQQKNRHDYFVFFLSSWPGDIQTYKWAWWWQTHIEFNTKTRGREKISPSSKPFEQIHLLHTNNKCFHHVSYRHGLHVPSNLFAQAMTFCLASYWNEACALHPQPAALHGDTETQRPFEVIPYRVPKTHGNPRRIAMEEGSQCESPLVNRWWECKESSWDM